MKDGQSASTEPDMKPVNVQMTGKMLDKMREIGDGNVSLGFRKTAAVVLAAYDAGEPITTRIRILAIETSSAARKSEKQAHVQWSKTVVWLQKEMIRRIGKRHKGLSASDFLRACAAYAAGGYE